MARRRPSYPSVAATMALVVALAGGAWAVSAKPKPRKASTIRGCYATKSGLLRVVKPRAACRRGERVVSWARQGPPGPPGPQGAAGPAGAAGDKGAPGATTVAVRLTTVDVKKGMDSGVVTSACKPGERATGGGFTWDTVTPSSSMVALQSGPTGFVTIGDPPTSWSVILHNGDGSNDHQAFVEVVCAAP